MMAYVNDHRQWIALHGYIICGLKIKTAVVTKKT